jgi:hypothetical protein
LRSLIPAVNCRAIFSCKRPGSTDNPDYRWRGYLPRGPFPSQGRYYLERGYAVALVDLPGQGLVAEQSLYWEAEIERPIGAVIDTLVARFGVNTQKLAMLGMSLGAISPAVRQRKSHVLRPLSRHPHFHVPKNYSLPPPEQRRKKRTLHRMQPTAICKFCSGRLASIT